jgi:hypothetical protein
LSVGAERQGERIAAAQGLATRVRLAPVSGQTTPSQPHREIDVFFTEYVFGFIATDIRREIDQARSGKTAGNFLCALGLLCYTEVLGGVKRGTLAEGQGKANFNAFFADLGQGYADLLDSGVDVYKIFRCGMAHEYLVKSPAMVSMLKNTEPAGIAVDVSGHYHFCVERYYEDFIAAARRLESVLRENPKASLPRELAGSAYLRR